MSDESKSMPEELDENTKLIYLMRFWLFGTFVIVFAAISAYITLWTGANAMLAIRAGFPIWGITAALCVITYIGYSFYLKRKGS